MLPLRAPTWNQRDFMVTKMAKRATDSPGDEMSGKGSRKSPRSSARAAGPPRPLALLTGASSGIGEALAHCFAKSGHDVILVARRAEKLKVLAGELSIRHGITAHVEAADLSAPGAAARLGAALQRIKLAPDVLVNCAGVL